MDDGGGAGPRQPTRQLGGRDGAAESGPALRLAASTAGAAVVQLTGLVMPAALGNRAGSSIAACKQLGLAGGGGSAARVVGGATVHGFPALCCLAALLALLQPVRVLRKRAERGASLQPRCRPAAAGWSAGAPMRPVPAPCHSPVGCHSRCCSCEGRCGAQREGRSAKQARSTAPRMKNGTAPAWGARSRYKRRVAGGDLVPAAACPFPPVHARLCSGCSNWVCMTCRCGLERPRGHRRQPGRRTRGAGTAAASFWEGTCRKLSGMMVRLLQVHRGRCYHSPDE